MNAIKYIFCIILLIVIQPVYPQNEIWEEVNGPSKEEIQCMTFSNSGKLFIADNTSGIYRSDDEGLTWERIFYSGSYSILYREIITGQDGNLYVAARNHLLVMNQNGNSVYYKYFNTDVYSVALNSQLHLYAATEDSGIARTTDFGESWEVNILYPDSNFHFTSVAIDAFDNIFVGSDKGIFKSTDNGNIWTSKNSGLNDLAVFDIKRTSNNFLFLTSNYGISRSTNGGDYWEYVNNGIPQNTWIIKIDEDGNSNIYFGDRSFLGEGLIYKSTNWGENWNPIFKTNAGGNASVLLQSGYLLAGSFESGLFRATLTDSSLKSIPINPIAISDFAENQTGEYYTVTGGWNPVRMSTDYGSTWRVIEPTWLLPSATGLWYEKNNILFIGTYGQVGLIKNKKIKYYWNLGEDDCGMVSSVLYEPDSNYVFASSVWAPKNCYGGIYRGKLDTTISNWTKLSTGLSENDEITSIGINSNKELFAGSSFLGIYRSRDLGLNWEQINNGLTDPAIRIIKIDKNDNIYVCTYSKIFRSTNNGDYWQKIADFYVNGFVIDNDNNLFIAVYNQVYKSTDLGESWTEFGHEFVNFTFKGLFLNDSNHLFVYGFKGIYRSQDPVTEVKTLENYQPNLFSLSQNYPNPFNPSTKIRYEIPGQARNDKVVVILKVYDVLGDEVATLVNGKKPAGSYEVEFNGNRLPSGIYFYQLQAGNFIQTKKMVLLR